MTTPPTVQRLTIRGFVNVWMGYGLILQWLFNEFQKRGIYCALRTIGNGADEAWGGASAVPTEMKAQFVQCRQPEEWELLIAAPDNAPTPQRKTVAFTMYESTEMPSQYVSLLNRSEVVVVPSAWNKQMFAENGVTKPIEVCPLGYDPEVFVPTPIATHGPSIFGIAGRTRHCARRKGIQESIDTFLKAFQNIPDVRLHVKLHPDDQISAVTDSRIKVIKAHYEPYELAAWMAGLTAFVTLSRGEGFGLFPFQALACGRPVIGTKYSGHSEFMNDANSFIVPHREVDAASGESNVEYLGKWAEPQTKDAIRWMQAIHANRSMAVNRGLVAAESVKHLTWKNTADVMLSIFDKYGVLK